MNTNGFTSDFTVEHWNKVKKDSIYFNRWQIRGLINGHKIKYVHQLQNLYFALTGKELEMKGE